MQKSGEKINSCSSTEEKISSKKQNLKPTEVIQAANAKEIGLGELEDSIIFFVLQCIRLNSIGIIIYIQPLLKTDTVITSRK